MVINDFYRFVFLHIPKTGGSSMMQALRRLQGDNRRWINPRTKHETLAVWEREWPARRTLADCLRKRTPKDYAVCGFVRNPWARMSSLYRYLAEKRSRSELAGVNGFGDFVRAAEQGEDWLARMHSMRPQLEFFRRSSGECRADFLGHFEYIGDDFAAMCKALGLATELAHVNRSSNSSRDYRCDYDDASAEIVANLFQQDIRTFGYCFDRVEPVRRLSGRFELKTG